MEYQLAAELNPTDPQVDAALRDARQRLRTKISVSRDGRTDLETSSIARATCPRPAWSCPRRQAARLTGVRQRRHVARRLPDLAKFANLNVVFDPAFRDQPISIDLRNVTLDDALAALTASTHTFYRVTAPRTITIVPDTPAKRREYEESVVRTFYLSNADIKEVIDLLRVVVDIRQISPITGTNAISIKDTPERVAAAARLIAAIDKARPEVIIDVELLEVDRTKLRNTGCRSPRRVPDGIYGIDRHQPRRLHARQPQQPDGRRRVPLRHPGRCITGCSRTTRPRARSPTRNCAPSDGIAAQARFGDESRCRSRPSRRSPPAASTRSRSRRSTTRTSASTSTSRRACITTTR